VKILLTRLDRVGDLLLTTPAIASVRRSWPHAHVTLVCSRYNAAVVERSPDVDAVMSLAEYIKPAAFGRRFRGSCDIALALAPRLADFELVRATGAPLRAGYTYCGRYLARATARLFLTRLSVADADPARSERDLQRLVRHEVEYILDVVRLAGGNHIERELVLPIDDVDRHAVSHVPSDSIVLHLGERWFHEGSSFESVVALIRELHRFERPIVVTYGVDVLEHAAAVRALGVADLVVGGLSFSQWAAVFEKSKLVITVDTGATHVASAMRRPTVVLFEHRYFHLSSQEWAPYRVPAACLRKPASDGAAELAASRESILTAVGQLLETEIPAQALS